MRLHVTLLGESEMIEVHSESKTTKESMRRDQLVHPQLNSQLSCLSKGSQVNLLNY